VAEGQPSFEEGDQIYRQRLVEMAKMHSSILFCDFKDWKSVVSLVEVRQIESSHKNESRINEPHHRGASKRRQGQYCR
jgi:hypothetical protein